MTCNDYIFFGLAAIALIVFRNRDARDPQAPRPFFRMPGHPVTTLFFLAAAWYIVGDSILNSPHDTLIGVGNSALRSAGLPALCVTHRDVCDRAQVQAVEDPRQ